MSRADKFEQLDTLIPNESFLRIKNVTFVEVVPRCLLHRLHTYNKSLLGIKDQQDYEVPQGLIEGLVQQ